MDETVVMLVCRSNAYQPSMKIKTTFLILAISALTLFVSQVNAQDSTAKADASAQADLNKERMDDAKSDNKDAKAKAKEARRVGKEADYAEKTSRDALKAEKKAQKARKHATKQSKKADDARTKSDKN